MRGALRKSRALWEVRVCREVRWVSVLGRGVGEGESIWKLEVLIAHLG